MMKLSGLKLHLTGQNKFNMESPPINERDFAELIKRHSPIINKVSYFYASEKVPFDDLRQEIYVNIWLGINQFKGRSEMSTWIYRVAVNSALMTLRSSRRRVETVSVDFGLLMSRQRLMMRSGKIFNTCTHSLTGLKIWRKQ